MSHVLHSEVLEARYVYKVTVHQSSLGPNIGCGAGGGGGMCEHVTGNWAISLVTQESSVSTKV